MPWDVSADPDARAQAEAWLKKRSAVTKAEYEQLSQDARERSFTIGGTVQLRVVQTVLSEVKRALMRGDLDLDAFKVRLRARLRSGYVDKNATRLKTTFNTVTQQAYGAGRWAVMNTDEGLEQFPFRMLDAVLDSGTTPLCRSLHRTVMRSNDPRWRRYWPPLHMGCRTSVRALSLSEGKRRGLSKKFPGSLEPDEGFGAAPGEDAFWAPDPKDFDSRAYAEYRVKLASMRARAAAVRGVKRKGPARDQA